MKIILSIFVLIFAGNLGFAQTISAGEIAEIRFKNDGGFGVDRGFEITFRRDGAADYHGGKNSFSRKGDFRGSIDEKQFAELTKLIIAQNFFALKDRYEGGAMDVGTRTITVAHSGRRKSVVNWGASEQKEFSVIETAIKAVELEIRRQTIAEAADAAIQSLLVFRDFGIEDVQARFDFLDFQIEKNVGYEKLKNLTSITDKGGELPTFFFKNRKQVMLYHAAEILRRDRLTPEDFYRKFGGRFVKMPSRAGKTHRQIIYPTKGIAFSTDGETLDFLEIFPPTNLVKYKREIYREVSIFAK